MTLDEMKLAVCEKLPELIVCVPFTMEGDLEQPPFQHWKNGEQNEINWPTEGLQVCHEAEKVLGDSLAEYICTLISVTAGKSNHALATYEQRLEALCRVWFPEKF